MTGACPIDPAAAIIQTDEPRPRFGPNARACAYVATNSGGPCYQTVLNETVARDCLMRLAETDNKDNKLYNQLFLLGALS